MASPKPDIDGSSSQIVDQSSEATKQPAEASPSNAPKQPPPEKPSDARRRTWVVLSFWSVVLFFGLPIWWITTSIYRAPLPVTEMLQWADGKVSFLRLQP